VSLPSDPFYDRVLANLQHAVQFLLSPADVVQPFLALYFLDNLQAQLATPELALPEGSYDSALANLQHLAQMSAKRGFPVTLRELEGTEVRLYYHRDYWFDTLLFLLQELSFLERPQSPARSRPELALQEWQGSPALVITVPLHYLVTLRHLTLVGADYLQVEKVPQLIEKSRFLLCFLLHLLSAWGTTVAVVPDFNSRRSYSQIIVSLRSEPLASTPPTLEAVLRQYADWLAQGWQIAQHYYRPRSEQPDLPFLGTFGALPYPFPQRPYILLFGGLAPASGRSTCLRNLAATLAQDQRVLCLSTQPRSSAPMASDFPVAGADEQSQFEPWLSHLESIHERLDVITHPPADPRLFGRGVSQIAEHYDFVLIDCHNLHGVAMQSVMLCADLLLLVGGLNPAERPPLRSYFTALSEEPAEMSPFPWRQGISQLPARSLLLRSWQLTDAQHEQLQQAYQRLGRQVPPLQTVIGWDEAYQTALAHNQTILATSQPSRTLADYELLAAELKRLLLQLP
jgi:cellulose biosynthesis protein BcsQ